MPGRIDAQIAFMDDAMAATLLQIVESTTLEADEVAARIRRIRAGVLSASKHLDGPNFTGIDTDDLKRLFTEYDREFFDGHVSRTLGTVPLHFGLSKRMTSSGGKTAFYLNRADGRRRYQISVSTAILFSCFAGDDHRPISGSGIVCRDRLDALQRVMEHELVHLVELLLWDSTSCRRSRFHSMTLRFFGHTENTHQMITPNERVMVKYGFKPGMKVRFRFDGVEHKGIVNRINKRVTVLVENHSGPRYTDGKCYSKFYVPAQLLERIE